ncbi:MAG: helix-turn-helix domain-containing protein [Parasphingorhabdus sp.]|uniref:helix-turn-helix domain-containing protein n=1 Tax=Parasphingorhabdus sp. TaxID=2709688 RepID=UPI003298E4A8
MGEASKLLGVGRSTIYRQIESGALGKRKIGSRTLIVRFDIDRILSSSHQAG